MKPVTLLKVTLLHGCFARFLNCTNDTKFRSVTYGVSMGSSVAPVLANIILTEFEKVVVTSLLKSGILNS